ncbi:hypothetical protein GGI43DRAFT_416238 [Trichoderma evansii]
MAFIIGTSDFGMSEMDQLIPLQPFPQLIEMRAAEEDWTGKINQSQRRKLQNRLNKRASRRRREIAIASPSTEIVDAGQPSLSSVTKSGGCNDTVWRSSGQPDALQLSKRRLAAKPLCRIGLPDGRDVLTSAAQAAHQRYRMRQPDPRQLIDVLRFNVFYALVHNAKVLGFNDDWLKYDAISPFGAMQVNLANPLIAANCPPNMKPTMLQTMVEHHPWIDLLPCPHMRDNFLKLVCDKGEDAVDEDGLCVDIVDGASARRPEDVCIITWGEPWKLSDWEVTESFMKKWAWLLEGCTELLESTNRWRKKRGLHDIRLA